MVLAAAIGQPHCIASPTARTDHAASHLEGGDQLRPRARSRGPVSRVGRDRHRLRLARQAHDGSGRLQAHQQAYRQGNRERRHRQGHQAAGRRLRRAERGRDQGRLSGLDADGRDRDLRRGRRDSLHLPGAAVLPRAGGQGREGLRAVARRDGVCRRRRRRPCRHAQQGAPVRADSRRRRAAAQHHPLGRGDPAARRDRVSGRRQDDQAEGK